MRRVTTINLRKSKFLGTVSKNKLGICLAFLYIFGIFLGAVLLGRSHSVYSLADSSFSGFLQIRAGGDFFDIALSSFSDAVPVALGIFLSGTSVVGVALSLLIICGCGFGYGITAGFIYRKFALQGIAFNALILIPCTLVLVVGYFICVKKAFGFSLNLIRIVLPDKNKDNTFGSFKEYCKSFGFVLLIFLAAALFDALMSVLFFKYFGF